MENGKFGSRTKNYRTKEVLKTEKKMVFGNHGMKMEIKKTKETTKTDYLKETGKDGILTK